MATPVVMPRMGYDMTHGKLIKWLKQVGEQVEKGEAIAEIETDKVNIDIEAFQSGILLEQLAQPGQDVAVGTPIATIGAKGEKAEAKAPPEPTEAKPTAPAPEAPAKPEAVERKETERVKASPLARRIARDQGLDLAAIQGTGPGGRIQRTDVEKAIKGTPSKAPEVTPTPVTAPREAAKPVAKPAETSPMREAIARIMSESKRTIPHFYLSNTIEMDAALAMLGELNAVAPQKLTINDLVLKAVALALLSYPEINARFENGQIRQYDRVHLGIAVAVEGGLVVPTLQDAHKRSLIELSIESKRLAKNARSGHMRQEDYGDATFTISNLGAFDVDAFMAIIVPSQAAILSVGTAKPTPVVRDGEVAIATVMKVSLSADHRITDGAQAARFMMELKRLLSNPYSLVI